jgi:glycosyltransferase involved in cell wall biosynthesis
MTKVLIATPLYPPDIGGPATYSKILVEQLPIRGVGVTLVTFGSVRKLPKIFRHLAYFFLILKRGWGVEIIYAQDPVSVGLPALCAALLLRKRFLLKIVGDYAWEQGVQRFGVTDSLDTFAGQSTGYSFMVHLFKRIERFVALRAERVIVPSKYLKEIITAWGIPSENIRVIYNSFEPPSPSGNRATLRGLLKFKGRLMISVGRLVPWKGFQEVISLMPALSKKFPGLSLFIVGNGPEGPALETLIKEKKLEGRVILADSVEHDVLMRYLEAADLFVLNTTYEGFSHLILEALSLGLPVVTTRVGGNPEIIKDGINGFLTKAGNRADLQGTIEKVLGNETLRKRAGLSGMETARSFTVPRMLSELLPLLKP